MLFKFVVTNYSLRRNSRLTSPKIAPSSRFVQVYAGHAAPMPPHWLAPVNRLASNRAPGALNGANANQALPEMFGDHISATGRVKPRQQNNP
jgi:hypothetical protein